MSGKRKGLSLEEKRQRMLEIFYERKEVFQLKELEKLGPQEKGIVAQSVKDVVTSLVDDGYVDSDKIGTSIYYWAFPSKAMGVRKKRIGQLEEKLEELKSKKQELNEKIQSSKVGREDTPKRQEILEKLEKAKTSKEELRIELDKYRDSDPEVFAQEKKEMTMAQSGAERWTDNVVIIRSWIKKKLGAEESVINQQFGIPDDFEDT